MSGRIFLHHVVGEPQPRDYARREVFDQDVDFRDHREQQFARARMLGVETEASLLWSC